MHVSIFRSISLDEVAAWLEEIMVEHEIVELFIMPVGMVVSRYDCIAIFKDKTK